MSPSGRPRAPLTSATSYRGVCHLASGGLAHVDLAVREEGRFRRLYAVKRLQPAYRDDTDLRAMFLEEARLAGLIRHPNVVSVVDVGEDEDGPFLVMDYVDGVPAGTVTTAANAAGELLPLQTCLRIAMDAAEGLHAAHVLRDPRGRPMRLVHRDVSPQNLLIGFDGITRVTDFGIAKALGGATQTATGVLKGKFGYMSPEQLRFEELDLRSDLFALGVVIFELSTGVRLYRNTDGMDGTRRILTEPPPDLAEHRDDVPAELVGLLFSMLAKDPSHRPDSAQAVARRLEKILADLAQDEGRVEVAPVVGALLAAEHEKRQRRVQEALAAATAALDVGRDQPTSAGANHRPSRRALAAALGILGLSVAAGGTWWVMAGTNVGESALRTTSPVQTKPTPSVSSVPTLDPPRISDDQGGEAEAESAPIQPRRRPRRRPRRGSPMADPRSGVPMWDWQ